MDPAAAANCFLSEVVISSNAYGVNANLIWN